MDEQQPSADQMQERLEQKYVDGQRAAYQSLLSLCLRELDGGEYSKERLVKERAETIAMLRLLCEDSGDIYWPDDLYLPDIIEKHLFNPMRQEIRRLGGV